jgi:hypothetical protein
MGELAWLYYGYCRVNEDYKSYDTGQLLRYGDFYITFAIEKPNTKKWLLK